MQKKAINIDPNVVGRYALGGALAGGSVATIVNLAHMIRHMADERKKRMATPETDENTIVLNLPAKSGEAVGQGHVDVRKTGPMVEVLGPYAGPRGQSRHVPTGKFGKKLLKKADGTTGWPTLTAAMLAALASGGAGAAVVNKMYEGQRARRMKAELEAAKQEYMDLLSGKRVKGAEVLEAMFPMPDGMFKKADTAFGLLNYPMAAMALLTILGTGGIGYLTKKVLDEKLRETNEKASPVPKVNRILIRTTPGQVNKTASAHDAEVVAGGLLCMMDFVGKSDRFLGDSTVKSAMAEAGITKEALRGTGNPADWDQIQGTLEQNPKLRSALYRLYVDFRGSNPVSRGLGHMALAIPGARGIADKKLYGALNTLRYGVKPGGASGLKAKVQEPVKTAQEAGMGPSLLGSILGKKIVGGGEQANPEEIAQAIVKAERAEANKDTTVDDTVRIEAKDPKAVRYLAKNRKAIEGVVKRLAQEGQI